MTKHVLDKPTTVSRAPLLRPALIERAQRPNQATLALQRRSRKRAWAQRAKFYTQFARGVRP